MKDKVFLWFGRFQSSVGYADATRNHFESLKQQGCYIYGIDIEKNLIFSPKPHPQVSWEKDENCVYFKSNTIGLKFIAIIQEVPLRFYQLSAQGLVRTIGYSFCEVTGVPEKWISSINSNVQEFWASSHHCKDVFVNSGVPARSIKLVPLCLDLEIYTNVPPIKVLEFTDLLSKEVFSLDIVETTMFLMVVSNFNRKDIATAIRSFLKEFEIDDRVCFLLKLPANTSEHNLKKFIDNPLQEICHTDKFKKLVKIIGGDFSFDQMLNLYNSCSVYVSTERAKGWDLPCMQAMALSKACIGIDWSANVEFMNSSNSILISHNGRLVYTDPHLYGSDELYLGHKWASVNEDELSTAMRKLYENLELRNWLGKNARQYIYENFTTQAVGNLILSLVEDYGTEDYLSDTEASVKWMWKPHQITQTNSSVSPSLDQFKLLFNTSLIDEDGHPSEQAIKDRLSLLSQNNFYIPLFGSVHNRIEKISLIYSGSISILEKLSSITNIVNNSDSHSFVSQFDSIFLLDECGFEFYDNSHDTMFWIIGNPKYLLKLFDMMNDKKEYINQFDYIFIPIQFYGLIPDHSKFIWINVPPKVDNSWNPTYLDCASCVKGGFVSLSIALQLSAYLGFDLIYLQDDWKTWEYDTTISISSVDVHRVVEKSIKCAEIAGSQVCTLQNSLELSTSIFGKNYLRNQPTSKNRKLVESTKTYSKSIWFDGERNYCFKINKDNLKNLTIDIKLMSFLLGSNEFNKKFPKIICSWEPITVFEFFDKYSIYVKSINQHFYITRDPIFQAWQHLIVVIDNLNQILVYSNDQLVVNQKLQSVLTLENNLYIGKGSPDFPSGRIWKGWIQSFNCYSISLTPEALSNFSRQNRTQDSSIFRL